MDIKEEKVCVTDLRPGMYVSRLDRPWLETPFLMQGFYINTTADIDELARHCESVYVDKVRSKTPVVPPTKPARTPQENRLEQIVANGKGRQAYQDVTDFDTEVQTAKAGYHDLASAVEDVMAKLRKGTMLDLPALKKAISPMIESVVRNPDAYLWLARLKDKDSYTYKHAVSTSIWAVAFGRHLGLAKKDIEQLALGCLLFDIGKTKLPEALLLKPDQLTEDEFELIKQHVLYGMEIVKDAKVNHDAILSIIMSHHERYDGSGYPRGLKGHEIPVFARMAAIVDFYDAVTSERVYGHTISPSDAVKELYALRDSKFQGELVEQFIQAIGLYPAGTIVELSDEQVGIVIAQNRTRRLRPKVMLILDSDKCHHEDFPVVDLLADPTDAMGNLLEIRNSLEPGAHGIDPGQYYL